MEVGDDALLRLDEVVLHDGGRSARCLVEEGVGHLDVVQEEDDGVNEDEGGGEVGAQLGDPAEVDGAERVADECGGRDAWDGIG